MLARELLMLVVLASIGAFPASLLSARFRAVERVGLAAILGLCLGASVFTTLLYFWPASSTSWLVPVLAVTSLVAAAVRSRRALRLQVLRANLAGWASLVIIVAFVTLPVLSVMRSHHSVGPVSYSVPDAIGYVAETDGEVRQSLHQAVTNRGPIPNLSQAFMVHYADSYQNLDVAPLSANVDSLAGLGATDSWDSFLIAFIVAGGLGAAASVRWALRESGPITRALAGGAAGGMFAGALFLQLYSGDSQAALCGLGLLLPLGAIAADAAVKPRPATLVVVALVLAGLIAVYPLFVAPAAAAGAVAVLFMAVRRTRANPGGAWGDLGRGALLVTLVVALAVLFNVVAFARDLRYWKALVTGGLNPSSFGFPIYDMRAEGIPSWLFQTRNLFTVEPWSHAGAVVIGEEIILPLVFAAVIVLAIKRFPVLVWLVVAVAIAALLGEYEALKNNCSYCTDRSLLPIAPLLAGLLAVGLGALWMSGRPLQRAAGLLILVVWIVPAFHAERDVRKRLAGSGAFLDSSDRTVLERLPPKATVDLEGFDASPAVGATPVEAFTYELADERSHGRATLPGDISTDNALAYFGVAPLTSGDFNPNYHFVLTRLAGVSTGRRLIVRSGGTALQERTRSLDVIVDTGLQAMSEHLDSAGIAWLSSTTPLRLVVVGGISRPAYVGVKLIDTVTAKLPRQPGVVSRLRGQHLTVCVKAQGSPPIRVAQFQVAYNPAPSSTASGPYSEPIVGVGLQLAALAVASGRCPYAPVPRSP
jgi:hypothetical protein